MSKIVPKLVVLSNDFAKWARPQLNLFWYYARVELTPPKPKDIPEIKNGISRIINAYKTGAWKQMTVKNAFLNALVATEVACWFVFGECIGKRHFVGYKLN